MATKYQRVHPDKWPGVYSYTLAQRVNGAPDVCLMINYRATDGKLKWEKVGRRSEGYTPQIAAEIRAERVRKARHGEEVLTAREIQADRRQRDRTLVEVGKEYFGSELGLALRGRATDLNRWEKHLVKPLGERRVSELTPADLERVKSAMGGKAPQTVKNALSLLRRVCRWGAKQGFCPPLGFPVELPRVDNIRTEFLTPAEADRLAAVLRDWPARDVARLVQAAMLTGLRRGELFKLQDRDVDRVHSLITLRSPKGGKTVTIPLAPAVAELFTEQAKWRDEHRKGSPFLFPGSGGGQRVDCGAVARIKAKARLPKSFRPFHGLRHHFAVTLANSGEFSLDMIGELLTHKSTEMTKRYGQFLPETKQNAAILATSLIMKSAGQPAAAAEAKDLEDGGERVEPSPRRRRATAKGPKQGERIDPATTPRRRAKGPTESGRQA